MKKLPSGKTYRELADEYNRSYIYVKHLISLGYSEEEMVRLFTWKPLRQICRERNVSYEMVRARVNSGMELEEALTKPFCRREDRGLDVKTKYWYKGQPLKRIVSSTVYERIKRKIRQGKGTLEELVEKELNK